MAIDKITGNGLSSDAVTPAAVSDVANTSTGQFDLPAGTTAQRPGSALTGSQRFNTDLGVMEYYDGSAWKKVSAQIPILSSITGNIYDGGTSTLTLAGSNFLSSNLVVNFSQSGDNINTDVTVTPSSDSAATVTVPAAVYNNVTAGNVVTIKVTNSDLAQSGAINKTSLAVPTGGTVSVVNGYRVHAFTTGSNFVIPSGVTVSADYLVVAGGGGGGGWGGGGGAGGTQLITSQSMTAGTFAAVVGAGGTRGGQGPYTRGGDGGNSSFNGTTSTGGGGGGAFTNSSTTNGRNGGSGGGGGIQNSGQGYVGGTGTSGQGNNGGQGGDTWGPNSYYEKGGGGGGKGAVGKSGNWDETTDPEPSDLGDGGVGGDFSSQFGTALGENGFFGGGGGGNTDGRRAWTDMRCRGGTGGGGDGGTYAASTADFGAGARGDDGTVNTGGGGGGSYAGPTNGDGTSALAGAGGAGIVLVRYQLT